MFRKMRSELNRGAGDVVVPFEFYFGPNDYRILKSYDRNMRRQFLSEDGL